MAIRNLERRLGVQLVDRSDRQFTLTPCGVAVAVRRDKFSPTSKWRRAVRSATVSSDASMSRHSCHSPSTRCPAREHPLRPSSRHRRQVLDGAGTSAPRRSREP
ncbi:LysR family transcriptional regulator [Rhodococcus sp. NPDC127530]